eukprot:TRINITY_DN12525_c0_g1_i1.p1 TRINITY_DN12525_c0_g1~~TRINITY_DN12525_c0_g1_i1.p1  ORF type:complete len:162 (-),score=18.31 TRINITY_DN12525_c0_g1_i1:60-545(-)
MRILLLVTEDRLCAVQVFPNDGIPRALNVTGANLKRNYISGAAVRDSTLYVGVLLDGIDAYALSVISGDGDAIPKLIVNWTANYDRSFFQPSEAVIVSGLTLDGDLLLVLDVFHGAFLVDVSKNPPVLLNASFRIDDGTLLGKPMTYSNFFVATRLSLIHI